MKRQNWYALQSSLAINVWCRRNVLRLEHISAELMVYHQSVWLQSNQVATLGTKCRGCVVGQSRKRSESTVLAGVGVAVDKILPTPPRHESRTIACHHVKLMPSEGKMTCPEHPKWSLVSQRDRHHPPFWPAFSLLSKLTALHCFVESKWTRVLVKLL